MEMSTESKFAFVAARVANVGLTIARKNNKKTTKKNKKPVKPKPEKPVKVSKPKISETDITTPFTEFSCRADISLSMDFEGQASKQNLVNAVKNEINATIKETAVSIARGFQLNLTNITVGPMTVECAVTDSLSGGEE
jgi:hypothetical protein